MKKYWSKITKTLLLLVVILVGGYFSYTFPHQVLPQAAIYFLDDAKLPEKNQTVLVFSPHPDDETIGVGGYIYEAVKAGGKVHLVLVSDGNKHSLKKRRYAEFKQATSILGVPAENLIFLNHPDGSLNKNQAILQSEFQAEINRYQPAIIVYPHPNDLHPDHAAVGKIVEQIIKNDNLQIISYQYLVHEHHFPQPKRLQENDFILPPLKLISFDNEWVRLMLSSEAEKAKKRALYSYKSQLRMPFLRSLILSSLRKNEIFDTNNNQ